MRYVDYTLALRAFWGAFHSTHHLNALAALGANVSLSADTSRFVASGRVLEKPSSLGVSKRSASWLLDALRCHGTVGLWASDAGTLLMPSPPLPMVTLWRPGITSACRRWTLLSGWLGLPAVVAALPLYACGLLWHHDACFRFGLGHF